MSYILDALKRAKAERDRGAAPSIHMAAPPQLADEDEDDDDAPRRASGVVQGQPLRWAVIGLSVALLLSLGWQFLGGGGNEAEPSRDARPGPPGGMREQGAGGPPPGIAGQGEQRPPPQGMPPPMQQGMQQPQPQPALAPAPAPAPLAPAPLPSAAPRPAPAPVAASPAPAVAPAPAASAAPAAAATQELPDDLRRSLAVGGSRYSDNPGSRIVFINGQVFREGDQPAAGMTIERIGLKSVTLVGRGQRYELKY